MEVNFHKVNCSGWGAGMEDWVCISVFEPDDDDWRIFSTPIEGFQYEWCYDHELRVSSRELVNPPMDGSSVEYTMVERVAKTPVDAGEEFTMTVYDSWLNGVDPEFSWGTLDFPMTCDTDELCDDLIAEMQDESVDSVDVTFQCPGEGGAPVVTDIAL